MPISNTDAISEFRKFKKAFEALEHAEAIMNALQEQEKLVRDLQGKAVTLESLLDLKLKELNDLQDSIDTLAQRKTEMLSGLDTKQEEVLASIKNMKATATQEANMILANARSEVSSMKSEISALETKKQQLETDVAKETKNLQTVKDNIAKTKADLIAAISKGA